LWAATTGWRNDTLSAIDYYSRGKWMTPDKSKTLKPGARVCLDGDQADRGTIKDANANYLTIQWDDGHRSFTGHRHMTRIELAKK
jgi:hypothetical protein